MSSTSEPSTSGRATSGSSTSAAAATRRGPFEGLRWKAGVVTVVVGTLVANAIALVLGFVAKALQEEVDDGFYERIAEAGTTPWTDVLETTTKMGNVRETQVLAAVLAIGLAVWFARRGWRWWVPLVVLPVSWFVERGWQFFLAAMVDRDRDPISLVGTPIGAYPSGGCARIILVTGVAAVLVAHYARTSRRTTGLMLAGVAVIGLAEAYFRARLNQHWLTDIIGGEIYGWMLVGVVVLTLRAFDPQPPRTEDPAPVRA